MEIYSAAQLMEYIQHIGFLPLLDSGICGYSAEDVVADDCRYVVLPDGGWDWPLWKWKGPSVSSGGVISVTTVGVHILFLQKEQLRMPY